MNARAQVPALPPKLDTVVSEYQERLEALPSLYQVLQSAARALEVGTCVQGKYVGCSISLHSVPSLKGMEESLLESAWRRAYDMCQIEKLAPASERSRLETELATPPELTMENLFLTFGDYLQNSRYHILRSVAEAFSRLDQRFKSHDRMKVGVKGLPKQVIITNCVGEYSYGRYGAEQLRDVLNALQVLRERPRLTHTEFEDLLDIARNTPNEYMPEIRYTSGSMVTWDGKILKCRSTHRPGNSVEITTEGFSGWREVILPELGVEVRGFKNGNAHVIFQPATLREINLALHEFYGDVLPDCPADNERPTKSESREVSKNLAFYWTPKDAADRMMSEIVFKAGDLILEPSAGEGHLFEAVARQVQKNGINNVRMSGIEFSAKRAATARAKGFPVQVQNFLMVEPNPMFSKVIMNPPFNGKEWIKHIKHALKFLAPKDKSPNGSSPVLWAILPASAKVDGHLQEHFSHLQYTTFDLPIGSFRESGTNVQTIFVRIWGQE